MNSENEKCRSSYSRTFRAKCYLDAFSCCRWSRSLCSSAFARPLAACCCFIRSTFNSFSRLSASTGVFGWQWSHRHFWPSADDDACGLLRFRLTGLTGCINEKMESKILSSKSHLTDKWRNSYIAVRLPLRLNYFAGTWNRRRLDRSSLFGDSADNKSDNSASSALIFLHEAHTRQCDDVVENS